MGVEGQVSGFKCPLCGWGVFHPHRELPGKRVCARPSCDFEWDKAEDRLYGVGATRSTTVETLEMRLRETDPARVQTDPSPPPVGCEGPETVPMLEDPSDQWETEPLDAARALRAVDPVIESLRELVYGIDALLAAPEWGAQLAAIEALREMNVHAHEVLAAVDHPGARS